MQCNELLLRIQEEVTTLAATSAEPILSLKADTSCKSYLMFMKGRITVQNTGGNCNCVGRVSVFSSRSGPSSSLASKKTLGFVCFSFDS